MTDVNMYGTMYDKLYTLAGWLFVNMGFELKKFDLK